MNERTRHESLERLLQVASEQGVIGPSALARALNESEQVVTNWGKRGVSKAGALSAQRRFSVSPAWVLDGTEPKMVGNVAIISMEAMTVHAREDPAVPLNLALEVVADALEALPEAARLEAAPLLQAMTLAPDSKRLRGSLLAVLMKR